MQVTRSIIGVDMAGIYCGDAEVSLGAARECDDLYNALFGSPIRRARQLGSGAGVIIDCDDGHYEVVVDLSQDGVGTSPITELRQTFFNVELYLKVASGFVTVCDTMCWAKPKSQIAGAVEWPEPLHFVRAPVPPGTYRAKLVGYSRAGATGDEQSSRRVFSEEDHAAWWEANRAYIRGDLPKPEFDAEKIRIESRTCRVVDGIALSFTSVPAIPVDYDPGDFVLELCAKQAAAKLIERRRASN